ncbi:SpoIIE family protein phosphatase [Anaerophilus nitritogenes]|uniref:SpoIIE family protein phosphatase n=1 Tax=Anaerophilus nitritogenes TaxID=2498136 RepID=UPI00101E0B4E|nr:SpoIIE family protein phosphatase [Anaerophilus nitritogenes]
MIEKTKEHYFFPLKYTYFILLFILSIVVFYVNIKVKNTISHLHSDYIFIGMRALKFIGIIICFMIFTITNYKYRQSKKIRIIIFSYTFFMVGSLQFLDMLFYTKKMITLQIDTVPNTLLFLIVEKIVLALGMLAACLNPYDKQVKWRRRACFGVSILILTFITYIFFSMYENNGYKIYTDLYQYRKASRIFISISFLICIFQSIKDYKMNKDRNFIIFAVGLSICILSEVICIFCTEKDNLCKIVGYIYRDIGIYLLFQSIFLYHIEKPYKTLKYSKDKIKRYAQDLERVVENRTCQIQSIHEKMLKDLEYAKTIQESFLPPSYFKLDQVKFVSTYIPCEKLSGDFYNIYPIGKEHIGMYIADVAGHGVAASMMSIFADHIMKPLDFNHNMREELYPDINISNFYKKFNESNFPSEMHIVVFQAVYHKESKILSYCSGGMNVLPILMNKDGKVRMLDQSIGFPICKFGEFFIPPFQKAQIQLKKGDRIIFYTDGLEEVLRHNELLEKEYLIHILQKYRKGSINQLNEKLKDEIRKIEKESVEDDITYFIIEV